MADTPRKTSGLGCDLPIEVPHRLATGERSDCPDLCIRAIINTVADGIITVDESGKIESANPATERMFGYAVDEMTGQDIRLLIPALDGSSMGFEVFPQSSDGSPQSSRAEVRGRRKDGSMFPIDLAVSLVELAGRRLFTGLVRDITERKQLEKEVLEISTHEQHRIGQELHDGLGQELTGLSYLAKNLQRKLDARGLPEARAASDLAAGLQRAIGQVRALAKGLVPSQVDAEVLVPALVALADTVEERYGVTCRVDADRSVRINSNHKAVHLYRIAQEAVHNAVKHGRAQSITLALSGNGTEAVLEVRDDGHGIRPGPQNSTGMGIRTMQYRARLIGGSLKVQAIDGGGTRVVCAVHQDEPHVEE